MQLPSAVPEPDRVVAGQESRSPDLLWHGRLAFGLWGMMLGVLVLLVLHKPTSPSLNLLWRDKGSAWIQGKNLYDNGFRYSPLVAALLAPLGWMPLALGAILIRLINAAALLGASLLWLRYAAPGRLDAWQRSCFIVLLALFGLSNLQPGQFNPLLAGLLVGSITAIECRRWNLAAALLAFATVFKVYPLAFALLLLVVYPRQLAFRLALALLVALALPFALQDPRYVSSQYEIWLDLLRAADTHRRFLPLTVGETYRDLLYLFRLYNIPISLPIYAAIQALCGLACAVMCRMAVVRGVSAREIGLQILMLGTLWLTLCGPASEPRTYGLLAPALAWWMVWTYERGPRLASWLAAQAGCLQLLCLLSSCSPHSVLYVRSAGLHPLSGLFLLGSYLVASPLFAARIESACAAGPEPVSSPKSPLKNRVA